MLRKGFLVAGGIGAVLSGLGLLLATLGGWGPCGPAGSLAYVGGILNVFHVMFYASLFGEFGTAYAFANLVLMFLVAAFDWTVLALPFALLFLSRSRRQERDSSPGVERAGDS